MTDEAILIELHPGAIDACRAIVAKLRDKRAGSPADAVEATATLHGLVDRIEIGPIVEPRSEARLDLVGRITLLMERPDVILSGRFMVAGHDRR